MGSTARWGPSVRPGPDAPTRMPRRIAPIRFASRPDGAGWTPDGAAAMRAESGVFDPFEVELEDEELLREVELTTNLIVAASECDEHLDREDIDRILGVIPRPRVGD